jgi:uncharacterized protein involved in exopolysaccharide biosynthesis/Mrp family chromosome partitioning ATPase
MMLSDIYFVLFRRKWIVLTFLVLGIGAAVAVFFLQRPLYQSQAKLLVRFVMEARTLSVTTTAESQVRTPDSRGENVINSEAEILNSYDLALEVAGVLGPAKILAKAGGGQDRSTAAVLIRQNLVIEPGKKSSIINLKFQHPDPAMSQEVLQQLIEAYFKKHVEVHRGIGVFDGILNQQTDQVRGRLAETEKELKTVMSSAGVVSVEDSKKSYLEQVNRLQQELVTAQADLAQYRAVSEFVKTMATNALATNTAASTNPVVAAKDTDAETLPQAIKDEYHSLLARLELCERRERELMLGLTLEHPVVKTNHLQLLEARQKKAEMEEANPGLLELDVKGSAAVVTAAKSDPDKVLNRTQVPALEAKIQVLTNELARLRAQANVVEDAELRISQLQRKKLLEEAQYTYFARNLEQARFDEALDAGKIAAISKVQSPSPPYRDYSEVQKKMLMALFGVAGAGLALAFLIELVLAQTINRPKDMEAVLHLPLFLYIPWLATERPKRNGHAKAVANGSEVAVANGHTDSELDERLRPFADALRDRLLNYFDVREMTHKPKLVALTSCDEQAGVSSIALGLATSLSCIGEGNILVVDMKSERGSARAFTSETGDLGLGEALQHDTRGGAMVQDRLYVVSAGSQSNPQNFAPRNFMQFVPRLKASDYDYIIFDMPPVTQTSITSKVARFMDMVFLVVESEKTDRQVARTAGELLAESKANIATILNRHRTYVPRWLQREFN